MAKHHTSYLIAHGSYCYYRRSMPSRVEHLDTRGIIKQTTKVKLARLLGFVYHSAAEVAKLPVADIIDRGITLLDRANPHDPIDLMATMGGPAKSSILLSDLTRLCSRCSGRSSLPPLAPVDHVLRAQVEAHSGNDKVAASC